MRNENGNKKSNTFSILQGISFLTQLGVSIAAPILLCVFLAVMAQKHLGAGDWVFALAMFFGLGGAISSFVGFAKIMLRKSKKSADKQPTSFNK